MGCWRKGQDSKLLYSSRYSGFNVETIKHKGINFTIWDVHGGRNEMCEDYYGRVSFQKFYTVQPLNNGHFGTHSVVRVERLSLSWRSVYNPI